MWWIVLEQKRCWEKKNINRRKREFCICFVATANVLIFIYYERSSLYTNYKMHMKFSTFLFHLVILYFFYILLPYSHCLTTLINSVHSSHMVKSKWCSLCFSTLVEHYTLDCCNSVFGILWHNIEMTKGRITKIIKCKWICTENRKIENIF